MGPAGPSGVRRQAAAPVPGGWWPGGSRGPDETGGAEHTCSKPFGATRVAVGSPHQWLLPSALYGCAVQHMEAAGWMDRWVDGLKALEKNTHALQKFSAPRHFCVPPCTHLAETRVTKPCLPAKKSPNP